MLQTKNTGDNKGDQSSRAALAEARRRASSHGQVHENLSRLRKSSLSKAESIRLANGWKIFDHQAELDRIGIQTSLACGVSTLNFEYKVCDSYPRLLGVPDKVRDDELVKAAAFRSKNRMIALVWRRGLFHGESM